MPNYLKVAKSLAAEIDATGNLTSYLTNHGPTAGTHRELILKSLIRERLPRRFEIVSGFIVTPDETSSQIDILVIDNEKPVLKRSGDDVVYVTPDAVKAIIEVKTSVRGKSAYTDTLKKLSGAKRLCAREDVWAGLFVFNYDPDMSFWNGPDDVIIMACAEVSEGNITGAVNCIAVGDSLFVRYWTNAMQEVAGVIDGPAWHTYFMSDLAAAYFIGNLIDFLSPFDPQYSFVWFPISNGKETLRRWYIGQSGKPAIFQEYFDQLTINGMRQQLDKFEKYKI